MTLTIEHVEKLIAKNQARLVAIEHELSETNTDYRKKLVTQVARVQVARKEINDLQADIEKQEEMHDVEAISTQERDEALRALRSQKQTIEDEGAAHDLAFEQTRSRVENTTTMLNAEKERVQRRIAEYEEMKAVMTDTVKSS